MSDPVDISGTSDRKFDLIPRLSGVPYGREMQGHILELAALIYRKELPSRAQGQKTIPEKSETYVSVKDCDGILEMIENTFRRDGAFLLPWEMDRRLIEKTTERRISAAALDLAADYGAANRTAEPLTGGHRKAQAPLITALAHLYAQARDEHVYAFDLDYSNMGGTNNHFYKVLCAAEGRSETFDSENKPVHDDLYRRAMVLTDRSARILAEIPRERILSAAPGARVEPLRVGGDEARYIGIGIPPDAVEGIPGAIHRAFENVTRDLGLHNHPYAKKEDLAEKKGFGGGVASFRLGEPGTPYHVAANAADEKISEQKIVIGKGRLSGYFYTQKEESVSARYEDARSAADYLRQVESVLSYYEGFYHIGSDVDSDRAPPVATLVDQAHLSHIPGPDDLRALLAKSYAGDLRQRNISLPGEDQALAGLLFLKYPYPDYVTDTLMDSDFPMMVGIARTVAERNQAAVLGTLPSSHPDRAFIEETPLWGMGIKFHNIKGFNAALKHEATNAVLGMLADDVLKGALRDVGIDERNVCVAHYGGGQFLLVALPVVAAPEGGGHSLIEGRRMQALEEAVERRLESLNTLKIGAFLARHQLPLVDDSLSNKTLGEIPNGDEKERGWKDGLSVTTAVVNLPLKSEIFRAERNIGGALVHVIQDAVNKAATEKDARLHAAFEQKMRVSPPVPAMF